MVPSSFFSREITHWWIWDEGFRSSVFSFAFPRYLRRSINMLKNGSAADLWNDLLTSSILLALSTPSSVLNFRLCFHNGNEIQRTLLPNAFFWRRFWKIMIVHLVDAYLRLASNSEVASLVLLMLPCGRLGFWQITTLCICPFACIRATWVCWNS